MSAARSCGTRCRRRRGLRVGCRPGGLGHVLPGAGGVLRQRWRLRGHRQRLGCQRHQRPIAARRRLARQHHPGGRLDAAGVVTSFMAWGFMLNNSPSCQTVFADSRSCHARGSSPVQNIGNCSAHQTLRHRPVSINGGIQLLRFTLSTSIFLLIPRYTWLRTDRGHFLAKPAPPPFADHRPHFWNFTGLIGINNPGVRTIAGIPSAGNASVAPQARRGSLCGGSCRHYAAAWTLAVLHSSIAHTAATKSAGNG